MYTSELKLRARYGETDQMGFVYYGNYASYYEVARVESLRKLGLTYKELEQTGIIMPVMENHSWYFKPATYDEELTIVTSIKQKPEIRITFYYEIFNENKDLIHKGETKLTFVNRETGRPCKPPQEFSEALAPFFNL